MVRKPDAFPITAHILDIDYCWCCGSRDDVLEAHHVVPRHLGGEQGPQVLICGTCHTVVHTYAGQKYRRKVVIDVTGWANEALRRLDYLSDVIVAATVSIEGLEVNKKWKYSTVLDNALHQKLARLARIYGSQDKAVVAAIESLYGRHCIDGHLR